MQRAVALRPDRGGERMIVRLRVVAHDLHLLFDEPFASRRHEAGRAAEVVLAVFVLVMPAGVDNHHVARPHHLTGGLFQVVVGDLLPHLFLDRDHDARAEEVRQRHLVDKRRALNDVRRSIDVRGVMHRGRDALRQYARLRHVVDAPDLHVLEIRPIRGLITEAMGQVIKLEPHAVVEVLLEHHAADFLGHHMPPSSAPIAGVHLAAALSDRLSHQMVRLYRRSIHAGARHAQAKRDAADLVRRYAQCGTIGRDVSGERASCRDGGEMVLQGAQRRSSRSTITFSWSPKRCDGTGTETPHHCRAGRASPRRPRKCQACASRGRAPRRTCGPLSSSLVSPLISVMVFGVRRS